MTILDLTSEQLQRAISIKDEIENLQNQLNSILGESTTPAETPKTRRKMSKAVRAKMAEAAKLRWAVRKGAVKPAATAAVKPVKKANKMSAAGRARIVAAQKARWAKIKAAKPAAKTAKKAGKMSAAGRARISAAAKARWAKAKAAGKTRL
jgi:hypothetical protein